MLNLDYHIAADHFKSKGAFLVTARQYSEDLWIHLIELPPSASVVADDDPS